MGTLRRDVSFAARMLAKSPGYTAVAVLTLALGIGANTAIFSTVDAVLLRPLPYAQPDRLVLLWETHPAFKEMSVAYLNYVDYRNENHTFTDMGAFRSESFNLTGQGEPERLNARMMSASLLPTLGVSPLLGRNFTEAEDAPNAAKVALLSHGLWMRKFAGDPAALGKSIQLSGVPYQIIGVLPEGFRLFGDRDLAVPLGMFIDKAGFIGRDTHPGIYVIGRLAPGVSLDQARADLSVVGAAMEARLGHEYEHVRPAFDSLHERLVEDVRPQVLTLFGAVIFVLLIAAANVANLMLARAMTRHKEMAVRAALGAGRLRLMRMLLVESGLLALLGGALGLLFALWGVDLLASARPEVSEYLGAVSIDGRVLAYTVAVALATGMLFGLAPALHASRQDLGQSMKEGDQRATVSSGRQRLRSLLVVVEVALALVLLVGAGLSIRNLVRLQRIDPGFDADHLLTMQVALPRAKYDTPEELHAFYDEVGRRVSALPEVASFAFTSGLPMYGASETGFAIPGQTTPGDLPRFAVYYIVEPTYFETMRIPLLRGRYFDARDRQGAPPAIVIDDAFARTFFPDRDPIGALVKAGGMDQPSEVIGVVRHVANYGLEGDEPARYQFYWAVAQVPDEYVGQVAEGMSLVARTRTDPYAVAKQVRAEIAAVDPDQPVYDVKTMGRLVADWMADKRFTMWLLTIFAALALVLATVGLYAVLANAVAQRTHEIGVRMALGARAADVVRLVVVQGARLLAVGAVVGLAGAFGLARLMSKTIEGTSTSDPLTFAGVVLLLMGVGLVATYIPARRATRVDPMVALRHE